MSTCPVVLVCMPWAMATRPSIALGIFKSQLADAGVDCAVRSYHLAFAEYLFRRTADTDAPIRLQDYEEVAEKLTQGGSGDWCFAVEPYRAPDPERDREYLAQIADVVSPEAVALIERIRGFVPDFLDECTEEIVALAPKIIGFTSTFCQNVPSLVLARRLKERLPDATIVLGGSNCDGPMGAALHRNFPWIDVVVRGEGERAFPKLVEELLADAPLSEQPGLCFRRDGELVHVPESGGTVDLNSVPMPTYDEYFDRLEQSVLETELRTSMSIPIEASRGCWWGAKHHCTFCGLNGQTMKFRSKSGTKVVDEIRALASKHQCLNFYAVDNIIDMAYFSSVLPALEASGWNLTLFFETKANLKRSDVKALAGAGVRIIQPGIESLASSVLTLMRKGVTALVNIRLLRLCAEYEVIPRWNLLHAFPGESAEAYAETAAVIPSLVHLYPPSSMGRLRIDRFSPFFVEREALGMSVGAPKWFYRYLYDVDDASLADLAYFFDGASTLPLPGQRVYDEVHRAVDKWSEVHADAYRSLRYQVGPDFVLLLDHRPGVGPARYVLAENEARIYLACDAGATPAAVLRTLGPDADVTVDEIREFLDELVEARLVYRESDRYLGLAVAEDPDAVERYLAVPEPEAEPGRLVSLRRRPVAEVAGAAG
jgi:ribosomal peptide maturation radical SAM protein 1